MSSLIRGGPLWFGGLALLLSASACKKDKDTTDTADSNDGDDSAVDSADSGGETDTPCLAAVIALTPADGATSVYYRDTYTVAFDTDGSAALIEVRDAAGVAAPTSITWSEGNVEAFVTADLYPSSPYTLHVELCGVTSEATFVTSDLGTPIIEGPGSLVGHTYMIQLSEADITTPAVLEALAAEYLTVPLLFDVTQSDESTITFLGGLGEQNDDGTFSQIDGLPTWDFPAGDFTSSPYFATRADYITLMYGEYAIPIEEFTLDGVFTSDGSQILEGHATGKADTRNMAELLAQPADNYAALCDLAGSLGVYCEACLDGEPYCLYIAAEQIEASYQPGLTLTPY